MQYQNSYAPSNMMVNPNCPIAIMVIVYKYVILKSALVLTIVSL